VERDIGRRCGHGVDVTRDPGLADRVDWSFRTPPPPAFGTQITSPTPPEPPRTPTPLPPYPAIAPQPLGPVLLRDGTNVSVYIDDRAKLDDRLEA
jgi:hypothetical protein